jgi:Senescence-associated protein.
MARKFAKSEKGQQIQNHKHFGTVKEIGKSTLHAAAAIYDGMVEALFAIGNYTKIFNNRLGRGIGDTTTKLVTAKYGEKTGQATKEGLQVVGNVGQVIKMTNVEAAKAIKEGTEKKN